MNIDCKLIFESLPVSILILDPAFNIIAATDAHLKLTDKKREDVIGVNVFKAFPPNPEDPREDGIGDLSRSLQWVSLHLKPHIMPVLRYDIKEADGKWQKRWWCPTNTPIVVDGKLKYIINQVEDCTENAKLKEKAKKDKGNLERLIELTKSL